MEFDEFDELEFQKLHLNLDFLDKISKDELHVAELSLHQQTVENNYNYIDHLPKREIRRKLRKKYKQNYPNNIVTWGHGNQKDFNEVE